MASVIFFNNLSKEEQITIHQLIEHYIEDNATYIKFNQKLIY